MDSVSSTEVEASSAPPDSTHTEQLPPPRLGMPTWGKAALCAGILAVVGIVSGVIMYQAHQAQVERKRTVSALESLIRDDRAATETMLHAVYSDYITYGDVRNEYEQQTTNREKLITQARAFDYKPLSPEIRTKFINMLEEEQSLVRALKSLNAKEMEFQSSAKSYLDILNNSSWATSEIMRDRREQYEKASNEQAEAGRSALRQLETVTNREAAFKQVAAAEKVEFEPVFVNAQDKIQKEARLAVENTQK